LFKQRDRYFMLAASTEFVSFESIEYKIIREYLNNNIRYLHKINFTTLLAHKFFISKYKKQKIDADISIEKFIENCKDEKVKTRIRNAVNEASMVVVASIVLRSLILLLLFPIYLITWLITNFSISNYIQNIIGIDSEFAKIESKISNKKFA